MNILNKFVNSFYLKLSRKAKKGIFVSIDLFIFLLSIFIAFVLRFDFFEAQVQILNYKFQIYLLFPIKLVFFWVAGVYRPVLRYTGLEFLGTALIASTGSTGILTLTGILLVLNSLPRSILILDAIITLILMVGLRLAIRWIVYRVVVKTQVDMKRERVIIYGAGEAGYQVVQALANGNRYKVVAFVDNSMQLKNQSMCGIKVHSIEKLPDLITKFSANSILLALDSVGKQDRRKIIENIQYLGIKIKTIPGVAEIISGKVSISEIRDIDIVDLLGREEVKPDPVLMQKNISGKVVLVTGAGGSIGSELCRQIATQTPKCLVLYELNEFALYKIDMDMQETFPGIELISILGSVLNQSRFESVLTEYQVDSVYHAAAYKHVPLIESNISEGVINNVKGTLACVKAAIKANVAHFILISTDKAVRPTNVMGATKRVAELILQACSVNQTIQTRFVMVRFGNVLDSAGSVVPRFRKQIAEGKNLTVTHENIVRFFMSIPEAARLVIQAGALGEGGDVFLLDMGEPVRIYDLATQMIELSGLTIGQDIDIEINGLRPGEKLVEELFIEEGNQKPTIHPKIYKAEEPFTTWEDLELQLTTLFSAAEDKNDREVLNIMKTIVPEFCHRLNAN